jgi:hypothetical protein
LPVLLKLKIIYDLRTIMNNRREKMNLSIFEENEVKLHYETGLIVGRKYKQILIIGNLSKI